MPLDQAVRSDLELYVFWLAWGVAAVHALRTRAAQSLDRAIRGGRGALHRASRIGYLVPNCDIGSMIAAGDWKMVAVDLSALEHRPRAGVARRGR